MLQIHTYIGGAIAILLVIRLILRFTVKRPALQMPVMLS